MTAPKLNSWIIRYQDQQQNSVIQELRMRIEEYPEETATRLLLSWLLWDQDLVSNAVPEALRVLARTPNHPWALILLGMCQQHLHFPQNALRILSSIDQDQWPSSLQVKVQLLRMHLFLQSRDWEQLGHFSQMEKSVNALQKAHWVFLRARYLIHQKQWDAAFKMVFNLDLRELPVSWKLVFLRMNARLQMHLQQWTKVLAVLQQAHQLDKTQSWIYWLQALVYLQWQQSSDALMSLQKLKALDPDFPELYYWMDVVQNEQDAVYQQELQKALQMQDHFDDLILPLDMSIPWIEFEEVLQGFLTTTTDLVEDSKDISNSSETISTDLDAHKDRNSDISENFNDGASPLKSGDSMNV